MTLEPAFRKATFRETWRASRVTSWAFAPQRSPRWARWSLAQLRTLPTYLAFVTRVINGELFTSGPNEFVVIARTRLELFTMLLELTPAIGAGIAAVLFSSVGCWVAAWPLGLASATWFGLCVAPAILQARSGQVTKDAGDALRKHGHGWRILGAARAPKRLVKGPTTKNNTVDRIATMLNSEPTFGPYYATAISDGAARLYRLHMAGHGRSGRVFAGLTDEAQPNQERADEHASNSG